MSRMSTTTSLDDVGTGATGTASRTGDELFVVPPLPRHSDWLPSQLVSSGDGLAGSFGNLACCSECAGSGLLIEPASAVDGVKKSASGTSSSCASCAILRAVRFTVDSTKCGMWSAMQRLDTSSPSACSSPGDSHTGSSPVRSLEAFAFSGLEFPKREFCRQRRHAHRRNSSACCLLVRELSARKGRGIINGIYLWIGMHIYLRIGMHLGSHLSTHSAVPSDPIVGELEAIWRMRVGGDGSEENGDGVGSDLKNITRPGEMKSMPGSSAEIRTPCADWRYLSHTCHWDCGCSRARGWVSLQEKTVTIHDAVHFAKLLRCRDTVMMRR